MDFPPHSFCPRFLRSPACNLPAPCLHTTYMLLPFACVLPVCSVCILQAVCLLLVLCLLSACTLHTTRTLPACCPCSLSLLGVQQGCCLAQETVAAKLCLSCRCRCVPRAHSLRGWRCWVLGGSSSAAARLLQPQPEPLRHPPLCPALPEELQPGGPSWPPETKVGTGSQENWCPPWSHPELCPRWGTMSQEKNHRITESF